MPFHSNYSKSSGSSKSNGSSKFSAKTGSTPNKKKPKTIFGFKIGPAPKSDVQKKIDSGQATVIATRQLDSGKSLISTNKQTGRITTKAEEDQKIKAGSSPTAQGRPADFPKKFDNAGANFSDFMGTKSQQQKQLESKSGGTPLPSGLTGANASTPTVKKTKLSPIDGNEKGISKISTPPPKGPIISGIMSQPTLLRGGDKGTKSGGTFASKEARQLLANATREGKGQYQGVLPTATTNFMGQKRRVAKVGSNFFRIKSNRRLAKDPMSGIQLKYFKNQLAKGTNELKWSLIK